jgi:hypothetical protein
MGRYDSAAKVADRFNGDERRPQVLIRREESSATMASNRRYQPDQIASFREGISFLCLLLAEEVDEARKRFAGKWTRLGAMSSISLWLIEP